MLRCVSRRLRLVHVACLQGPAGDVATRKANSFRETCGSPVFRTGLSGGYTVNTFGVFADAGQIRYLYEEQVPIIREFCGCGYGKVATCS